MAVEHGCQVILTDRVTQNAWARDLLGRPGVHVASSLDVVMDVVEWYLRRSASSAQRWPHA